jgi:hypothetical protein
MSLAFIYVFTPTMEDTDAQGKTVKERPTDMEAFHASVRRANALHQRLQPRISWFICIACDTIITGFAGHDLPVSQDEDDRALFCNDCMDHCRPCDEDYSVYMAHMHQNCLDTGNDENGEPSIDFTAREVQLLREFETNLD